MSKVISDKDRESRLGRIQAIVQEDFERIEAAADPYAILNLENAAGREEIRDRYERYERFYRVENFQRLGDSELTRMAIQVRRAIGRAIAELEVEISQVEESLLEASTAKDEEMSSRPPTDPDAAALGDIYFRDGLTYLRLGDFNAAADHLSRAVEYDPSRGILLANLAYTRFKVDPTNPAIVEETGASLERAAEMEPSNPEIFALLARFGINTRDRERAHRAIDCLQRLRPEHPGLNRLKKRSHYS